MSAEQSTQKRLGTVLFYGIVAVLEYFVFLVFQPFLPALCWAIIIVVVSYPAYVRLARRFRPTLAALICTVGVTVILIVPALLSHIVDRIGDDSYVASAFTLSLAVAAFSLKVWGIFELLFFRGTSGPNRFGPDSLAPIEPQPRWDQESELKFVPPSAGPPPGPHVMRGA